MRSTMLAVVLLAGAVSVQAATLTFGIVPQQSAKKLAKKWTPILRYISAKTGDDYTFGTAKNIPTFEKRLADGQYDIAYMNPYHYTVFNRQPGYLALARQKDKKIKGIMVVHKDSPLQSLSELANQKLAFPAPAAFAASVLPRAQLTTDKIPFKPAYVSSHDSVYLNVAKGYFPAGGGVMRTFNNTAPEVRAQLRVLWTTRTFTPHAIAAHPSVDSAAVSRLSQALVGMNTDPEGRALLKTINFKGMQLAQDKDWDDVRNLGLNMLDQLIKQ